MRDFRAQYESYLSRRKSVVSTSKFHLEELFQAELSKFVLIRDTIRQWLASSDGRTEKEWQQMILKFILLIFPKYIAVLENVQIDDHYSKPGSTSARLIDIALVDANGNLDVIEIKRPFDDVLLSRTLYRDNFVLSKDLSGTIMQAEKYLFHLSKWGVAGETKLTKTYNGHLPSGMSIRITNPKALLILGRGIWWSQWVEATLRSDPHSLKTKSKSAGWGLISRNLTLARFGHIRQTDRFFRVSICGSAD
jgi:hypothetical protein